MTDIARDPVSTTALKHVKRRHFFVREVQHAGEILVMPVDSNNNIADAMTKELKPVRQRELKSKMQRNAMHNE